MFMYIPELLNLERGSRPWERGLTGPLGWNPRSFHCGAAHWSISIKSPVAEVAQYHTSPFYTNWKNFTWTKSHRSPCAFIFGCVGVHSHPGVYSRIITCELVAFHFFSKHNERESGVSNNFYTPNFHTNKSWVIRVQGVETANSFGQQGLP
jgi:hypothetical protein